MGVGNTAGGGVGGAAMEAEPAADIVHGGVGGGGGGGPSNAVLGTHERSAGDTVSKTLVEGMEPPLTSNAEVVHTPHTHRVVHMYNAHVYVVVHRGVGLNITPGCHRPNSDTLDGLRWTARCHSCPPRSPRPPSAPSSTLRGALRWELGCSRRAREARCWPPKNAWQPSSAGRDKTTPAARRGAQPTGMRTQRWWQWGTAGWVSGAIGLAISEVDAGAAGCYNQLLFVGPQTPKPPIGCYPPDVAELNFFALTTVSNRTLIASFVSLAHEKSKCERANHTCLYLLFPGRPLHCEAFEALPLRTIAVFPLLLCVELSRCMWHRGTPAPSPDSPSKCHYHDREPKRKHRWIQRRHNSNHGRRRAYYKLKQRGRWARITAVARMAQAYRQWIYRRPCQATQIGSSPKRARPSPSMQTAQPPLKHWCQQGNTCQMHALNMLLQAKACSLQALRDIALQRPRDQGEPPLPPEHVIGHTGISDDLVSAWLAVQYSRKLQPIATCEPRASYSALATQLETLRQVTGVTALLGRTPDHSFALRWREQEGWVLLDSLRATGVALRTQCSDRPPPLPLRGGTVPANPYC
jgi:hypothetical protein